MNLKWSIPVAVTTMAVLPAIQDSGGPQLKTRQVADNIYMLEGPAGGNIGAMVGEDGVLLIDDQFDRVAGAIRSALQDLDAGDPTYVVNTHFHADHTGANPSFADAAIIAHHNVYERLDNDEGFDKKGLPDITYGQDLRLRFNGQNIRIVHFSNCHTDGDSVIFFEAANVVHMGDLMFNELFPFVDVDSGGDIQNLTAAINELLENIDPQAEIIPGHGPVATWQDLLNYRDMLEQTYAFVERLVGEGKSLADIKKIGLQDQYKTYSWRFITEDKWIEALHRAITQSP